ncbi:MAG: ribosomal protein S18 acetylase RimI-like enzyme [Paracoccaceae bacterium]|mgnify:FL=1
MEIRTLEKLDFSMWLKLYEFYAEHYEVKLTPEGVKTTWSWLMDEAHPTIGLIAIDKGEFVGLVHFRAMPSPLRGENLGFIDDIVVKPTKRNKGIAKKLINAVKAHGINSNWKLVRWITRDNNYQARAVYDKLSEKSDWNVYELKCF